MRLFMNTSLRWRSKRKKYEHQRPPALPGEEGVSAVSVPRQWEQWYGWRANTCRFGMDCAASFYEYRPPPWTLNAYTKNSLLRYKNNPPNHCTHKKRVGKSGRKGGPFRVERCLDSILLSQINREVRKETQVEAGVQYSLTFRLTVFYLSKRYRKHYSYLTFGFYFKCSSRASSGYPL